MPETMVNFAALAASALDGGGTSLNLKSAVACALSMCSTTVLISPPRASEVAQKGRQAVSQSRETVTSAIERGREAYQQARSRENA